MRSRTQPRSKKTPTTPLLPFRAQHGGPRKGAGRKPKYGVAGVTHRQRAALASRFPVHVTMKLNGGLRALRNEAEYTALRSAFVAGCRGVRACGAFRLCHYAVLNDHLHFVVEAKDRTALSRALQGLSIRIARALNKLWGRHGKVFADRYHDRILRSPREVRNVIRYVLANGRKHAAEGRNLSVRQAIDIFTSAPWFDGFRERFRVRGLETMDCPVASARTWLLGVGWRRHGLLSVHEMPASRGP